MTMPPLPEPALIGGIGDYRHHYTADQVRAYGEACTLAERERCIAVIEAHQVPVGNSRAGELAAEWTMDALREVRNAIRYATPGTTTAAPVAPAPPPSAR